VNEIDVTQAATAAEPSVTLPLLSPSLTDGKAHFNENCADCHTQSGSTQKSGDSSTNLISTDWLRKNTPTEMYTYLTTGAPAAGMPAFSTLSSGDRWDVVAYLLSLISSDSDVGKSSLVYQNMCQDCHGKSGSGDGALAQSKGLDISSWRSNPLLIEYSNEQIYNLIRSGNEHEMGTFAVMLSEAQIWSLVATTRAFSLTAEENADNETAASSQSANKKNQPLADEGTFFLVGSVSNASGGPLLDLSEIKLVLEQNDQTQQELSGFISQDGNFRFENVPYHSSWSYYAEMEHGGITYRSSRIYGQDFAANALMTLSFKVYDSTSQIAALRAERLHILLSFQSNGKIHVTENYLINNSSSYTIIPVDSQSPLLTFLLSKEAQNVIFEDSAKAQYLKVADGSLEDWQPILPGSVHQVMFEYDLPFTGERTLEFVSPLQVASAMVMVEDQNGQVNCSGMQTFNQRSANTASLKMFTTVNIQPGGKITLSCFDKQQILPVVVGIISVLFMFFAIILILTSSRNRRNRKLLRGNKGAAKTTILDAIITLDDQLKAGEISMEVYQAKREELIKRLEGE
jgi:mono/diheme cytochrome c family protein